MSVAGADGDERAMDDVMPGFLVSPRPLPAEEFFLQVALIAALAMLAWLFGSCGWDEQATAFFFSAQSHSFPLRDTWVNKNLLHDAGKQLPALLAIALLVLRVRGRIPASRWHDWRQETVYALAVLLVSTGIVGFLKDTAPIYCPWSLADYGGSAAHYTLGDWLGGMIPAQVGAGYCWPSGHAAGAFGMIGVYFALRARRHRSAHPVLLLLLAWGALAGYTQIARGAHFVSHVLWSMTICLTVALALLPVLKKPSRLALASAPQRPESEGLAPATETTTGA